ncbi:laminin subunit beta-4-like [Tenrec ecaudatus]|uniref:laminin subunit beta-4-like n=1 Tax=Tenrec ecaudatus TaxID=94439 RepID=UPI003F59EC09
MEVSLQDFLWHPKYFQMSFSAEKKSNETSSTLSNSENTRNDSLRILDAVTAAGNLLEKLKQIKIPDIQTLNEKVCGKPGQLPRALAPCSAPLCKDPEGYRRCGGPCCQGSLAHSWNTLQKAQETETVIHNLDSQVQGFKNQINTIKNITKLVGVFKSNALQLTEKMESIKNQSESEKEKTNLLVEK